MSTGPCTTRIAGLWSRPWKPFKAGWKGSNNKEISHLLPVLRTPQTSLHFSLAREIVATVVRKGKRAVIWQRQWEGPQKWSRSSLLCFSGTQAIWDQHRWEGPGGPTSQEQPWGQTAVRHHGDHHPHPGYPQDKSLGETRQATTAQIYKYLKRMKRKNSHEKANKKHSLVKTQVTRMKNQQNRAFPVWFQSLP